MPPMVLSVLSIDGGDNMKRLLLGSFVALAMGSAAVAADMPVKAPPPVAAFSWTGCYVGIEGGGAWGRSPS